MLRSLRFSFSSRPPTRPTPFLASPLKIKGSLEQRSFQKPLGTLNSLPRSFPLRRFSSSNIRNPHDGDQIKQSPPRQTKNEKLMEILKKHNQSFNSAIKAGDVNEVLKVIEQLRERNLSLHAKVLKSAVSTLIEQRNFAKELFQQTGGDDPSIDVLTLLLFFANDCRDFNLMNQVLSRMLKSKELERFNEQRLLGIFSLLTEKAFGDCFSSLRNLLVALRTHTGHSFTRCFWQFFESLGKMKEYQKFLQLFDTMMELGIQRDKYLDTTLLRNLALAGDMEGMKRIYATTEGKDSKMYVSLLGSLAKRGRREEMQRVLQDMNKDGLPLDHRVFNTLISTRGSSFEESWKLFNEMKARNITPTTVTYNILIDRCGYSGKLEMIEKILQEVETSGIKTDPKFHFSVSGAYQRCGRVDLALEYEREFSESIDK